jgi:hypothetical protein
MVKVVPLILHADDVVVKVTDKPADEVALIEKGESPKLLVNDDREKLMV